MKRIIYVTCLLMSMVLLFAQESAAQASIGIKGGLNMSSLKGLDPANFDAKYKTGYHAGIFAQIHLGKKLAIQPELVYSTQGGSIDDGLQVQDIDLDYFNVPVMIRYGGSAGFYLELGPQFGFSTGEVDWNDLDGSLKKSDFSMCAGVGYLGNILPVGIGLRYNLGISASGDLSVNPEELNEFKNGVFQVSIYWRLFGK